MHEYSVITDGLYPLISAGHVVRFCTPGHPDPDCVWTDSAKWGDDIGVCACNTDLCNSASLMECSVTLLVTGWLLAFLCIRHTLCDLSN